MKINEISSLFFITFLSILTLADSYKRKIGFYRNNEFLSTTTSTTTPSPKDSIFRTTKPPCCRDMLGTMTCQRLQKINEQNFGKRCNKDAEFRLIQCCTTCNKYDGATPYDAIAETLVSESCFDRYGGAFCQRYVNSTDVWSQKHWSCSGTSPHISFRSCRQSCGFCDFDKVVYTLQNALDACKHNSNKDAWKERLRRRLYVEKLNKTLP